jgi:elongation factor P
LYADADHSCFMNPETFEQTEIPNAMVGPSASFLEPGMRLVVEFVEGRPVSVVFPEVLEVKIASTAPPTHQQQDAAFKSARLENGAEVMVPQFIKAGDTIRLAVVSMKYMDRVKADAKTKHG